MTVWVIKGGELGELEKVMLENSVIAVAWPRIGNLVDCKSKGDIEAIYKAAYPLAEKRKVSSHVGQLFAFQNSVSKNDLVVLPQKKTGSLALGLTEGDYMYRVDLADVPLHTHQVNWLFKEISRSEFEQDLLYSFGSFLGFCKVERNNAEERIKGVIAKLTRSKTQ